MTTNKVAAVVSEEMVRQALFYCPHELPTTAKHRWIANEINREVQAALSAMWRPMEEAPLHKRILMRMKHGIIEGTWDGETGSGYYWTDLEWYPDAWMPIPGESA